MTGVKGIAAAHIAASKKAHTSFFYVVDADAEVLDSFTFDFKPGPGDTELTHIWHAENPIGCVYGYGGIKLFAKKFFKDVQQHLDFSTTLTRDIKVHEEVACVTRFNSDPLRAFRGAFRESVKLEIVANDQSKSEQMRSDALERLMLWQNPAPDCKFREFIICGATAGRREAVLYAPDDLHFINDHDISRARFKEHFPGLDLETIPSSSPDLFFTTRIASVLYDDFVLSNLPVTEIRDALSDGQLLSKKWLVDMLLEYVSQYPGRPKIAILGGWIGTLALMINSRIADAKITSIDIDERSNRIAEKLNYGFDFKALTQDMFDVDYAEFDIIINTSSEHITNIASWRANLPDDKLLIVQNNNYTVGMGHVSCVSSVLELEAKLSLSTVHYEGTRKFRDYDRYMIIGKTGPPINVL